MLCRELNSRTVRLQDCRPHPLLHLYCRHRRPRLGAVPPLRLVLHQHQQVLGGMHGPPRRLNPRSAFGVRSMCPSCPTSILLSAVSRCVAGRHLQHPGRVHELGLRVWRGVLRSDVLARLVVHVQALLRRRRPHGPLLGRPGYFSRSCPLPCYPAQAKMVPDIPSRTNRYLLLVPRLLHRLQGRPRHVGQHSKGRSREGGTGRAER